MGKAIASELVQKGAIVTIMARREAELKIAVEELSSKGRSISYLVGDVTDPDALTKVFDVLINCAGSASTGFFADQEPSVFEKQMKLNYLGSVYPSHCLVTQWIKNGTKGKIVFISSTLGLMGMVGYSPYSPTKFAIRGLAESLRQELKPHGISIHVYYVGTIDTPGQKAENETKPLVTKLLEEGDISDSSPRVRAQTLIQGIEDDCFAISSDLLTDLIHASSFGSAPRGNIFVDWVKSTIANAGLPIWSWFADRTVQRSFKNKLN